MSRFRTEVESSGFFFPHRITFYAYFTSPIHKSYWNACDLNHSFLFHSRKKTFKSYSHCFKILRNKEKAKEWITKKKKKHTISFVQSECYALCRRKNLPLFPWQKKNAKSMNDFRVAIDISEYHSSSWRRMIEECWNCNKIASRNLSWNDELNLKWSDVKCNLQSHVPLKGNRSNYYYVNIIFIHNTYNTMQVNCMNHQLAAHFDFYVFSSLHYSVRFDSIHTRPANLIDERTDKLPYV